MFGSKNHRKYWSGAFPALLSQPIGVRRMKITINGMEINAQAGVTILEAAEQAEIYIRTGDSEPSSSTTQRPNWKVLNLRCVPVIRKFRKECLSAQILRC
jgi:hypothetical protein